MSTTFEPITDKFLTKENMIPKEIENLINEMLDKKELEMCNFLNAHLSDLDRRRIGEDIIRIMPNRGDIAQIQITLLSK